MRLHSGARQLIFHEIRRYAGGVARRVDIRRDRDNERTVAEVFQWAQGGWASVVYWPIEELAVAQVDARDPDPDLGPFLADAERLFAVAVRLFDG